METKTLLMMVKSWPKDTNVTAAERAPLPNLGVSTEQMVRGSFDDNAIDYTRSEV